MMQLTEEQRKALAAEIVEQLVDCGSADDVAVERYVEWVFKRLSTITPPVSAPAVSDDWTHNLDADAALVMLDRLDTLDPADDARIEGVKRIIRKLAAEGKE